jgi:hypothetical protein
VSNFQPPTGIRVQIIGNLWDDAAQKLERIAGLSRAIYVQKRKYIPETVGIFHLRQ